MQTSPDPIADPTGYQQHLLSLLAGDDPAVVQAATPADLRHLLERAGSYLRTRPEPSEWSVFECMAHVTDAELVMAGRYRFVMAQDEPPLIGYDQDLWVDRLHGTNDEPSEMIELFESLRAANVSLWLRTSDADRARIGMHAERGPESFDLAFRMIAGHDRFHVAQAERALEQVRGG